MISLGSKFNRLYSLNLMFNNNWCDLTILFNKNNLYTAYQLDQTTYSRLKKNNLSYYIFFDIKKSSFANTFFDISDIRTQTLDIKNQFNTIFTQYKDLVRYELNETIKLSRVHTNHGDFDNILNIYIFRLSLMENDFLYCLTERQLIDTIMQKKIVRTSAYQLQTKESGDYLSKLISKKSLTDRKIDTPETLVRSILSNDITPQQKRGGLL